MAVLRHPPSRRDRLPCARARACHGEAPLVLHDSRKRRAAKTRAPDRSSGARLTARRKNDLCGSRRAGKESEKTCRAREESGDAIFAEESDPVHIACGRGDSRADPRPRLQGLKLGGPGTAVRSHVDARAACFASSGRPRDRSHHAVGVCRGGVTADSLPIVAVGPHAGDPHYEPKERGSAPVREGDLLLLDIWGKTLVPNSVYYDITWKG